MDWLVPDLIPLGMLSILIGEEGIGKGLFSCLLISQVTTGDSPQDVLLMSGEDDPARMLRPRLGAAGADLDRVHFFTRGGSSGVPCLPEELDQLRTLTRDLRAKFIIGDPWMSMISPRKQVKDTQQARQVFDPLNAFAKEEQVAVLLVGHTNRGDPASARNRYGGSVAVRQVSRHCLMAVPDPAGPDGVIIGVEKSNIASIEAATRYVKTCSSAGWHLVPHPDQYRMTISQHLQEQEARDRYGDRRRTQHKDAIQQELDREGVVSRRFVVEAYQASGSTESAADKALDRWTTGPSPFLTPLGSGLYGPSPSRGNEPPVPPAFSDTQGELS